jgi:hypothetical protein
VKIHSRHVHQTDTPDLLVPNAYNELLCLLTDMRSVLENVERERVFARRNERSDLAGSAPEYGVVLVWKADARKRAPVALRTVDERRRRGGLAGSFDRVVAKRERSANELLGEFDLDALLRAREVKDAAIRLEPVPPEEESLRTNLHAFGLVCSSWHVRALSAFVVDRSRNISLGFNEIDPSNEAELQIAEVNASCVLIRFVLRNGEPSPRRLIDALVHSGTV